MDAERTISLGINVGAKSDKMDADVSYFDSWKHCYDQYASDGGRRKDDIKR